MRSELSFSKDMGNSSTQIDMELRFEEADKDDRLSKERRVVFFLDIVELWFTAEVFVSPMEEKKVSKSLVFKGLKD